jgi:hypothetical protein
MPAPSSSRCPASGSGGGHFHLRATIHVRNPPAMFIHLLLGLIVFALLGAIARFVDRL